MGRWFFFENDIELKLFLYFEIFLIFFSFPLLSYFLCSFVFVFLRLCTFFCQFSTDSTYVLFDYIYIELFFFDWLVSDKCYSIRVALRAPRYVMVNGTATLKCEYDVNENQVYKVEWLRGGNKIYQFIKGRNPPFNNFTVIGADIDVSKLVLTSTHCCK